MSGNANSGRNPKSKNRGYTELTLADASPAAARYLKSISDGKEKGTDKRIKVAMYIIDQDLGRPSQRVVHVGDQDNPVAVADAHTAQFTLAELRALLGGIRSGTIVEGEVVRDYETASLPTEASPE